MPPGTGMRALLRAAAALLLLGLLGPLRAHAQTLDVSLDLRLVDSDGERSFLDGGLGTLRYGEDRSGLQLGRLRLALTEPLGQLLTLKLDASSWGGYQTNPLDLTEAYLQFRPYPQHGFRLKAKAGAFYAPFSLANRAAGWETPYTLSSSALDSWIAEELRTIGLETSLEWLGTHLGYDFDVGLVAGVFGWNEPAGAAIATNGFVIDDRQTTLFGVVGEPGVKPVDGLRLFRELDGRAGEYEGLELRYLDRITVRAVHYDNQANPAAFDPVTGVHAWATSFDTAGIRGETPSGWTAIVQWLGGETSVSLPGLGDLYWKYDTRYGLVSKAIGAHTLSVRYDDFTVAPQAFVPIGAQSGHALTAAYLYQYHEHWRAALEWVRVRSSQSSREFFLGQPPLATESALQLSVRYAFSVQ
jgi:hypothetical protein